jgi:hypothetical protein
MSDLQTAFYIVGIVFMSLMLLITLVLVATVVVIRIKVVAIHKHIEDKLGQVINWAEKGTTVIEAIRKVTHNQKK